MNDVLHIITGATGFLGRGLVRRLLDEGEKVCIIVRDNEAVILTKDQIALLNYTKEARASGMTDEQISMALRDSGWSEDDIGDALGRA